MRPTTWTATDPCACCLHSRTWADTCPPDCGGKINHATGYAHIDHANGLRIKALPASLPLPVRDAAILRVRTVCPTWDSARCRYCPPEIAAGCPAAAMTEAESLRWELRHLVPTPARRQEIVARLAELYREAHPTGCAKCYEGEEL